jgi:hypothetical protein
MADVIVSTRLEGSIFSPTAARYDYQPNTAASLTAVAPRAAGNGQST